MYIEKMKSNVRMYIHQLMLLYHQLCLSSSPTQISFLRVCVCVCLNLKRD